MHTIAETTSMNTSEDNIKILVWKLKLKAFPCQCVKCKYPIMYLVEIRQKVEQIIVKHKALIAIKFLYFFNSKQITQSKKHTKKKNGIAINNDMAATIQSPPSLLILNPIIYHSPFVLNVFMLSPIYTIGLNSIVRVCHIG